MHLHVFIYLYHIDMYTYLSMYICFESHLPGMASEARTLWVLLPFNSSARASMAPSSVRSGDRVFYSRLQEVGTRM